MAILITGAQGMVGSNLKAHFERQGIDVVSFEGDATETSSWELYNGKRFDAIVHLAAYPGVRESFKYPERYYYNNTMCMENFLKYGSVMSDKLLYASSSNAYEWWLNPYAGTKKMNECQARPYRAIGMRFHTVFPGRPDMLFRKLQNNEVTYINTEHHRDFIHVRDLCEVIELLVNNFDEVYNSRSNVQDRGVVDIGTGQSTPVKDVAKLMGYTGEYVTTEAVGERVHTVADVNYLFNMGWIPKRSILDVKCHVE